MKTYTEEELKVILNNHEKWLNNDDNGVRVNLRNADLRNADLGGANLYDADLGGADLYDANLGGVFGNMKHIKSLQTEMYYITYTSKIIQIGCQLHTIDEWKNFNNKSILEMGGKKALEWWNKWKPIIMQIIEMSPCEPTKEDDNV